MYQSQAILRSGEELPINLSIEPCSLGEWSVRQLLTVCLLYLFDLKNCNFYGYFSIIFVFRFWRPNRNLERSEWSSFNESRRICEHKLLCMVHYYNS